MTELTNIAKFRFTEKDVKIIVEYLVIDSKMNKELIQKVIKFGNYIKKINNN